MQNQNQNADARFTNVSGSGQGVPFPPQKSEEKNNFFYDPNDPRNVVEGFLKECRNGIKTQYGEMTVWALHTVIGDGHGGAMLGPVVDLIEDSFLEDKLPSIALNSYVRIKYAGRALTKAAKQQGQTGFTKTNSYHSWEIGVWEEAKGAPKYADFLAKAGLSLPQPKQQSAPQQSQQQGYNQTPQQQGYINQAPQVYVPPVFSPNQQPVQQQPVFNPNQGQQQGQPQFNPNQGQHSYPQQQVFQHPVQNTPPAFNPNQGQQQQQSFSPPAPVQNNPLPPAPQFNPNQQPVQQNNNVGFGHTGPMPNPGFDQEVKF